jgi:hypothetical protein
LTAQQGAKRTTAGKSSSSRLRADSLFIFPPMKVMRSQGVNSVVVPDITGATALEDKLKDSEIALIISRIVRKKVQCDLVGGDCSRINKSR